MIPKDDREVRYRMIHYMIKGCVDNEEQLNEWEKGFIHNIDDVFNEKNHDLTDRQADKLEKIYNKLGL